jgi:hypothetical protein
MLWQAMTEIAKIPQIDPPDLQTSAEALTFGGSFNLGIAVFPVYATFVVTAFAAAFVAVSTAVNTRVGVDLYTLFSSAGSILSAAGSSGSFGAAWNLFIWFVPVTHIMTCVGTYAWFAVGRMPIYVSWVTIKSWMSA